MRVRQTGRAIFLGGLLGMLIAACGESANEPGNPQAEAAARAAREMVDSGSWYSRNRWPHDGDPYESAQFVVYSDGSSLDARHELATLAEEVLAELVVELGIDAPGAFQFPSGQSKIHIYANRHNVPDWGGGARGYWGGLIIWSLDHEAEPFRSSEEEIYAPVLKHELIHVVESLLKGRFVGDLAGDDPRRMPVWFSEGMAEALTGGTAGGAVKDQDRISELEEQYGRFNPVSFRVDVPLGRLPDPLVYFYQYYPMFQLAVEYLIDPEGLGRSSRDLGAVMLDLGEGERFDVVFERHMGIGLAEYEEQFYGLMEGYLRAGGERESGLAVVSVALVVALASGAVAVWSLRVRRRARSSAG